MKIHGTGNKFKLMFYTQVLFPRTKSKQHLISEPLFYCKAFAQIHVTENSIVIQEVEIPRHEKKLFGGDQA